MDEGSKGGLRGQDSADEGEVGSKGVSWSGQGRGEV